MRGNHMREPPKIHITTLFNNKGTRLIVVPNGKNI